MTKIQSISQLKKEACKESGFDGFIALGDGNIRSSKQIFYNQDDDTYTIFHGIDGSEGVLTEEELTLSNIGIAIKNNRLYKY